MLLPEPPEAPLGRRRLRRGMLAAALLVALAALWRWSPLSAWVDPAALAPVAEPLRGLPLGPPLAVFGMSLAASLLFPITVLIVTCALVYDAWLGFVVALGGCVGSAMIGYGAGRVLWRGAAHRGMSPRLRRLSRYLGERGIWAIAAVRIVPVAPFGAINLAAGASHVGLRDYLLGTVCAMAPGVLAMTALAESLKQLVVDPGWTSVGILAALVVTVALVGAWLQRRVAAEAADHDAR